MTKEETMARRLAANPERPNDLWADEFGITRQRVQEMRKALNLPNAPRRRPEARKAALEDERRRYRPPTGKAHYGNKHRVAVYLDPAVFKRLNARAKASKQSLAGVAAELIDVAL